MRIRTSADATACRSRAYSGFGKRHVGKQHSQARAPAEAGAANSGLVSMTDTPAIGCGRQKGFARMTGSMPKAPTRLPAMAASSCRCRPFSISIRRRARARRSGWAYCCCRPIRWRRSRSFWATCRWWRWPSRPSTTAAASPRRSFCAAAMASRERCEQPARCCSTNCRICCASASMSSRSRIPVLIKRLEEGDTGGIDLYYQPTAKPASGPAKGAHYSWRRQRG